MGEHQYRWFNGNQYDLNDPIDHQNWFDAIDEDIKRKSGISAPDGRTWGEVNMDLQDLARRNNHSWGDGGFEID